jgi:hypothetical protein
MTRKRTWGWGALAAAALLLPAAANAQVFGPGPGGAIPDGTGPGGALPDGGSPGLTFSSVINVSGTNPISTLSVSLDLTHTWVGDLRAQLVSPNGTTMDLFRRPGRELQPGSGDDGDSSNLAGVYTFADTPSNASLRRLIDAANAAPATGDNVATGTYVPTNNTFNLNGTPTWTGEVEQSFATTFGGENPAGNWTLNINDWALNDLGTLNSWTLTITPVPEPGTFALCGVGLAGFAAYRRRRARAASS